MNYNCLLYGCVSNSIHHNLENSQILILSGFNFVFWCLAFIYWLTKYDYRTKDLYTDVESFMSMFDDNKESIDIIKNEVLLRQFFLQAPKVEKINKDKIHSIVESSLD